jgi:hypothetical protein
MLHKQHIRTQSLRVFECLAPKELRSIHWCQHRYPFFELLNVQWCPFLKHNRCPFLELLSVQWCPFLKLNRCPFLELVSVHWGPFLKHNRCPF